jgi:hypothetical protein
VPQRTFIQLTPQVLSIAEDQSLLVRLDEGVVQVVGNQSEQLQVNTETFLPEKVNYQVVSTQDQIQIIVSHDGRNSSKSPVSLQVEVPNGVKVKIDTEYASITVRDYEGELEAASIAGDILIQGVKGMITARSNRGDVKVEHSAGKVSVVGNYGLLSLEDVRGDTGVSTIMGTIIFNGSIGTDDVVRLETDHGPIGVNFDPDSAFGVEVRSTSGEVVCVIPGITSSLRACDGVFNSVGGTLTVRTVSGAVNLQMAP